MLAHLAAAMLAFVSWTGIVVIPHAPVQASIAAPLLPDSAPTSSASSTLAVPILVYHIVRPAYPSDTASVRKFAVTPEVFDAQMNYLREGGFHVTSFPELERALTAHASLPAKSVILSFDDAWSDQYTYAFPILKKYDYPATFFVFTNAIGTKGFLTWDELKEMLAAGMTIGDHSRSHPYLTKISSPEKLWDEVNGSKMLLEEHLGVPVHEFAYPFGQFNASTTEAVKKAGYHSARGDYDTGDQSPDRLYNLSAINAPTSLEAFKRILAQKLQ